MADWLAVIDDCDGRVFNGNRCLRVPGASGYPADIRLFDSSDMNQSLTFIVGSQIWIEHPTNFRSAESEYPRGDARAAKLATLC